MYKFVSRINFYALNLLLRKHEIAAAALGLSNNINSTHTHYASHYWARDSQTDGTKGYRPIAGYGLIYEGFNPLLRDGFHAMYFFPVKGSNSNTHMSKETGVGLNLG